MQHHKKKHILSFKKLLTSTSTILFEISIRFIFFAGVGTITLNCFDIFVRRSYKDCLDCSFCELVVLGVGVVSRWGTVLGILITVIIITLA